MTHDSLQLYLKKSTRVFVSGNTPNRHDFSDDCGQVFMGVRRAQSRFKAFAIPAHLRNGRLACGPAPKDQLLAIS